MNIITSFFKGTMEVPTAYGWFHIMWSIIVVIATILLVCLYKNCSDKKYRKIALFFWIIYLVFELYKQISLNYNFETHCINFQWYIFPFQFCSTPFYVLPFIIFMKDNKVRDSIILFTSTFVLLAGVLVYIIPDSVYTAFIGINIQTMIHHGMQIVFPIFSFVRYKEKFKFKAYPPVIIVFASFMLVAVILNEMFHYILPEGTLFNMFFISRHFVSSLVVFCDIQPLVPYLVFLLIYLFAFSLGGFIVYSILIGIKKLMELKEKQVSKEKLV